MRSEQVSVSKARQMFNRLDAHLRREGLTFITVTRHGETAFAIAAQEFIDTLLETMEILSDPEWAEKLRAAVTDIQAGRVVDHEQVKEQSDG